MFARLIRLPALAALVLVGLLMVPAPALAGHGVSSLSGLQPPADLGAGGATRLASAGAQSLECMDTPAGGRAGIYRCENVDLESILPLPQPLGLGSGNDMWGWTDPQTGKNYAVVGSAMATTFVDVSDPEQPVVIGYMPSQVADAANSLWRDIKVDGNHAFVVAEQEAHGMQVFDLTRLRDAEPGAGTVFTADAVYHGQDDQGLTLSNSHNISINEETDFAYIIGTNTCRTPEQNGGLHMVDISDPEDPQFAGCARVEEPGNHNYVHDVECVIYRGPDRQHRGDEICFGSNEEVVVIYDVTDKANPQVLSQTTYETNAYTHQGWLTQNQRFFLFGDELDEGLGAGVNPEPDRPQPALGTVPGTTTYIMQARDLENPSTPLPHTHETQAIDHNLYIRDGLVYQSNYTAGVRILDFTSRSLRRGELEEVGYFDTFPVGDPVDPNQFAGTWSNYTFSNSGIVVATAIEGGTATLFVLRPTGEAAAGNGGGDSGGGSGGGGDSDDDDDDDDEDDD